MAEPRSDDTPDQRAVRRFNLTVPLADESIIQWFDAQENKSVSIRMVVREYIERYGYTDPLCRPAEQGPRRGRPPMSRDNDRDVETLGSRPARVSTAVLTNPPQFSEPVETTDDRVDAGDLDVFTAEIAPEGKMRDDDDRADEIQEIELDENGMPVIDALGY